MLISISSVSGDVDRKMNKPTDCPLEGHRLVEESLCKHTMSGVLNALYRVSWHPCCVREGFAEEVTYKLSLEEQADIFLVRVCAYNCVQRLREIRRPV